MLAAAVERAQQFWPDRLIAAYALGSLAHGGFSAVSDVDVAFVLADPLLATDAQHVAALNDAIKASNAPFADRLSVFWGSLPSLSGVSPGGRFPPLDRLDLKKYGRLIVGRDVRESVPFPARSELVVVGAELALRRLASDDVIRKLKSPEALLRCDQKTLTRLILWPVRFLYTARTGDVGRNDVAVEHFAAAGKERAATELVRLALKWRHACPAASDQDAAAAIAAGAAALYHEFLADYEPRLRQFERPDLAASFREWRQRL